MTPRKLLVLGATGGTGQQVVSQALHQGHQVTALVRNPQKLSISHDRLRVITGAITDDVRPVAEAVREQDVVISALGVGKSFKSSGLIARSARTIVAAMETQGVRRLIFVSALGVGDTRSQAPLLPRIFYRLLLGDIYADKKAGDDHVRHSGLDWTLVYPAALTNGPRTGTYKAGERLELRGFPTVSRADVADFILTQIDEVTYLRKIAIVSS